MGPSNSSLHEMMVETLTGTRHKNKVKAVKDFLKLHTDLYKNVVAAEKILPHVFATRDIEIVELFIVPIFILAPDQLNQFLSPIAEQNKKGSDTSFNNEVIRLLFIAAITNYNLVWVKFLLTMGAEAFKAKKGNEYPFAIALEEFVKLQKFDRTPARHLTALKDIILHLIAVRKESNLQLPKCNTHLNEIRKEITEPEILAAIGDLSNKKSNNKKRKAEDIIRPAKKAKRDSLVFSPSSLSNTSAENLESGKTSPRDFNEVVSPQNPVEAEFNDSPLGDFLEQISEELLYSLETDGFLESQKQLQKQSDEQQQSPEQIQQQVEEQAQPQPQKQVQEQAQQHLQEQVSEQREEQQSEKSNLRNAATICPSQQVGWNYLKMMDFFEVSGNEVQDSLAKDEEQEEKVVGVVTKSFVPETFDLDVNGIFQDEENKSQQNLGQN